MPSPIVFHSMTSGLRISGDEGFTVPRPDGVRNGDLLVLAHVITSDDNIPDLPGWTRVHVFKETGSPPLQTRLHWKVAHNEPESYDFTPIKGARSNDHVAAILRYTGNVAGKAFNRHVTKAVYDKPEAPYLCPDIAVEDPHEVVLQVVGNSSNLYYSLYRYPYELIQPGPPWRQRVNIHTDSLLSIGLVVLEGTGKLAATGPELGYKPGKHGYRVACLATIAAALNPDMSKPLYDDEGKLVVQRRRPFVGWGIPPVIKAVPDA